MFSKRVYTAVEGMDTITSRMIRTHTHSIHVYSCREIEENASHSEKVQDSDHHKRYRTKLMMYT